MPVTLMSPWATPLQGAEGPRQLLKSPGLALDQQHLHAQGVCQVEMHRTCDLVQELVLDAGQPRLQTPPVMIEDQCDRSSDRTITKFRNQCILPGDRGCKPAPRPGHLSVWLAAALPIR